MKKQIVQALKSIGKFLGSAAVFCLFFYAIILIFAQGYLSLNDQYRILRNGLLLLLLFVIAIPMKFSKNWISDNLKRILGFKPRISKPLLVSLGHLFFKILLWNVALFLISRLVLETLYPLLDPMYPGNYVYFESDLNLLYFTISALVTFRLFVLYLYPQFNYEVLAKNVKKFLARGKFSTFSAITSLILLALLAFLLVSFLNSNKQSTLYWSPKIHSEQASSANLTIDKFSPDQGKISGVLSFETNSEENNQILKDSNNVKFNFLTLLPVRHRDGNNNSFVSSEVDIEISGSDYFFPFNQYEVTHVFLEPENSDIHFKWGNKFLVESKLSSIVLVDKDEPPLSSGPYSFYIEYSSYFKLLVVTIGIAFLGLFGSVLMAKSRNQIIELAVGIFAALLAIRSYLIPDNISSPILVDQLFLLYIISLMIVLFIRINKLNWENNA